MESTPGANCSAYASGGWYGVGATAAGEVLVGGVAELDELVGDRAEPVGVVHRAPGLRERAAEEVGRQDLEEVVLVVEPGGQPGVGRDPGVRGVTGGVVPVRGERLGKRGGAVEVGPLLAGAVFGGVLAGEQRSVDREGPGGRGDGLLEHRRLLGDGLEGRARGLVVAVDGQPVLPDGVHHDEDDVPAGHTLWAGWRGIKAPRSGAGWRSSRPRVVSG